MRSRKCRSCGRNRGKRFIISTIFHLKNALGIKLHSRPWNGEKSPVILIKNKKENERNPIEKNRQTKNNPTEALDSRYPMKKKTFIKVSFICASPTTNHHMISFMCTCVWRQDCGTSLKSVRIESAPINDRPLCDNDIRLLLRSICHASDFLNEKKRTNRVYN